MYKDEIKKSLMILKKSGVIFETGMSEKEFLEAEKCYGVKFPLDYKALLAEALPFSGEDDSSCWCNFTDWRNLSEEYVSNIKSKMFDWTIDGVLYTTEYLGGWLEKWGIQPKTMEEKKKLIKKRVKESPLFIPIISNKFLALTDYEDNPVYSIHDGIDVICYGKNIWDFIENFFSDNKNWSVDLKAVKEPVPKYNEFVYRSINNFFYLGRKYYDEHGNYLGENKTGLIE